MLVVVVCVGAPLKVLFFFNDTATTEIYTLSLHDALPISDRRKVFAVPFTAARPTVAPGFAPVEVGSAASMAEVPTLVNVRGFPLPVAERSGPEVAMVRVVVWIVLPWAGQPVPFSYPSRIY